MNIKLICTSAALTFCSVSVVAANEGGPHAAFFADVRSGRSVQQLPVGMPDPAKLAQRFNSEPRVIDWAVKIEGESNRALERVDPRAIKWRKVTCNKDTCELLAVLRAPTASKEQALYDGVLRQLSSVAVMYDKEIALAVGGDVSGELAVVAYIYGDEG